MPAPCPPPTSCRWALVSLGEVMLRLDPGDGRIHTTRTFQAWEGGGEYNVARGLRRCFGLPTAIVTALADNPVGRLVEDLMLQGGVDQRVRWVEVRRRRPRRAQRPQLHRARLRRARGARLLRSRAHRRLAAEARATSTGTSIFGTPRRALVPHRRHLLRAVGDHAARREGGDGGRAPARHASSPTTSTTATRSGRPIGGQARAREVNRELAPLVDVILGNEEDFSAALGFERRGRGRAPLRARSARTSAR